MQSRRAFIGSAATLATTTAAGVTFVAPTDLLAQAQAQAHAHGDVVHQELIRQLQTAVKGLRETGRAEYARTIASVLRIAAAHGEATGLDVTWKNGLTRHIRQHGRRDAVTRPVDRRQWEAEMRSFGETNPELPFVSEADRGKALDVLTTSGVTPTLRAAAAVFEESAMRLAARSAANGIVRVQDSCDAMRRALDIAQFEQTMACAFSFIDSGVACAFLSGVLAGLYLTVFWYGC